MLEITRFASFDDRMLGRATFMGRSWYTIEKPWKDNTPYKSCIPADTYDLVRVNSPKYGENMWEIQDVPNRTHILIHVANWSKDVLGCVGLARGLFKDLEGVSNSGNAVSEFYKMSEHLGTMPVTIVNGRMDATSHT